MASQQIMIIPFTDQVIGQGFNRKTGESIGTALSVPSISEDKTDDGQRVTTFFQVVTDQDSLRQALGISADVDVRYLLFSADAKMSFTEQNAVNSYSSFVAGRCQVKNAQQHGSGFTLTETADAVLKQDIASGTNDFKTAYGDMFVRDLNTGGEFLVVARITSISQEHQQNLSTSLSAAYNGLTVAVDFQGEYDKAMKETQNHTEVSVFMTQSGGVGGQVSFTGPDAKKVLDRLDTFPEYVHEHSVGYEAVLATYDTIPLPIPPEPVKEAYEIVLADCAQQKIGFLKALSDLSLAASENGPSFFDDLPSVDVLTQMQGQYRKALSDLLSHAIRVSTGQMDPPQEFVANPTPPPVNFKKKPFVPPALQVQIPDVSRMTVENATQTLNLLGLVVNKQFISVSETWLHIHTYVQLGSIITQEIFGTEPPAGTMVNPKSTVTIQVAQPS